MRASTFFAVLATALAMTMALVSAQTQPQQPLPCYQEKCSGLLSVVSECGITVIPSNGTIVFPTVADESTTEQCICKQKIIDAYDPCYLCGAEYQRIGDRLSSQKLVDSCNLKYKTDLHVPGQGTSAASSATTHSALFVAALTVLVSAVIMA